MKTALAILGVFFLIEIVVILVLVIFGKKCSEYCDACDEERHTHWPEYHND